MTKFPASGEVVRVHFDCDTGGMFGYYAHRARQWWVQDAGSFRKVACDPIAWSPIPSSHWHDVSKTTPGDTTKDVLFYHLNVGRWVDKWADRGGATHWTELPDPPPKPEFKVGGVYKTGQGSARITQVAVLNATKYLFGTMGPTDTPNVWDETGHAVLSGADRMFDLQPLPA